MEIENRGSHPNSRKNLLSSPPKGAQRKGAYAAMRAKKEKKQIRDAVEYMLNLPIQKGRTVEIKNLMEAKTKNLSVIDALILAQVKKAMSGDTRAYNALIDTAFRERLEINTVYEDGESPDDIILQELRKRNIEIEEPEDVVYEEDGVEADGSEDREE